MFLVFSGSPLAIPLPLSFIFPISLTLNLSISFLLIHTKWFIFLLPRCPCRIWKIGIFKASRSSQIWKFFLSNEPSRTPLTNRGRISSRYKWIELEQKNMFGLEHEHIYFQPSWARTSHCSVRLGSFTALVGPYALSIWVFASFYALNTIWLTPDIGKSVCFYVVLSIIACWSRIGYVCISNRAALFNWCLPSALENIYVSTSLRPKLNFSQVNELHFWAFELNAAMSFKTSMSMLSWSAISF